MNVSKLSDVTGHSDGNYIIIESNFQVKKSKILNNLAHSSGHETLLFGSFESNQSINTDERPFTQSNPILLNTTDEDNSSKLLVLLTRNITINPMLFVLRKHLRKQYFITLS